MRSLQLISCAAMGLLVAVTTLHSSAEDDQRSDSFDDYQAADTEARLKTRLARFRATDIGKRFSEKILSSRHADEDPSTTLIGIRIIKSRKQHIYLFKRGERTYAFAWVEKGGKAFDIPAVREDSTLENALTLEGDSLTSLSLSSNDGVVILQGATEKWLKALKN